MLCLTQYITNDFLVFTLHLIIMIKTVKKVNKYNLLTLSPSWLLNCSCVINVWFKTTAASTVNICVHISRKKVKIWKQCNASHQGKSNVVQLVS